MRANSVGKSIWLGSRFYINYCCNQNVLWVVLILPRLRRTSEEQRNDGSMKREQSTPNFGWWDWRGFYEESDYYKMSERKSGPEWAIPQFEVLQSCFWEKISQCKMDFCFACTNRLWDAWRWQRLGKRLETLLANRPYTIFKWTVSYYPIRIAKTRAGLHYAWGLLEVGRSRRLHGFLTKVTGEMAKEPVITNLEMDGILDETAEYRDVWTVWMQLEKIAKRVFLQHPSLVVMLTVVRYQSKL